MRCEDVKSGGDTILENGGQEVVGSPCQNLPALSTDPLQQ
jgi:hypothetical protein